MTRIARAADGTQAVTQWTRDAVNPRGGKKEERYEMANLNKVMLMGNLTKDSELRYLPSGSAVLEFRMAVNRRYRTQSGEERDETLYIDVSLFGQRRAEGLHPHLKRGKPMFVEGRLKLDEWERDGQRQSKISVVAENVEFLGGGREDGSGGPPRGRSHDSDSGRYGRTSSPAPVHAGAPSPGGAGMDLSEDEIPF